MPKKPSASEGTRSRRARPLRVLLAKPGLDGHNRGVHVIGRALRDAGMEVVYLGLRRTPREIAVAAVAEDVDVVGLSILSGAHMTLMQAMLDSLADVGGSDIPVVVGGIVPDQDAEALLELGIRAVLGPGSRLADVISAIRDAATATSPA